MASPGVHRSYNGGNASFSFSQNSKELHSRLSRTRSFSKEVKTNFFKNPKPMRQMSEAHRPSTLVVNVNNYTSRTSSRHLIHSDPICHDRRRNMKLIHPKKEIVEKGDISEKLDQWMRDSVVEIVKNIGEAPFLVHIYSDGGEGSSSTTAIRLVREKAVAESWPLVRGRWEGGSPTPNGVILVEELKSKEVALGPDKEKFNGTSINGELHSTTKVWGVLIQGRGINCTACYILKTCRVQSLLGFCTHFCLVRAECFVENAEFELKKFWLQR